MAANAFLEKLRNGLRRFSVAQGGNVVITFALTTVPLIGFVGAAVDYSRANSAKAAMQAAVDATALMLSKEITTLTATQISQKANAYFAAQFNRTEVAGIAITPIYTTSGGSQVVVTGAGTVPTTFTKILGLQTLNINVSSTVRWGNTRLRVALALDNTGSMASAGKMTALKTATKNLLSMLQASAASNGDVYVSIIPFSKDVNVGGSSNYSANWIDWSDWDDDNGSWQYSSSCSGGSSRRGRSRCTSSQTWAPANHNTWNGCITDRDQSYDTLATAPNPADVNLTGATPSTLFPAEQYGYCPLPMKGLSYDWTAMNTLVDQMYPNGNTNQAIGLAWAWLSLVGGGPLTAPAKDTNFKYNDVIILLSDGLNTEDRWYTSQSSIDARQQITCNNVKAAGVTLYTVHVNTDGDPTSTLLRNCASDSSKFFILTSANDIVTTFNQIGTQLSNLRVAK
jgi:Flp pilus assembly protein TadG